MSSMSDKKFKTVMSAEYLDSSEKLVATNDWMLGCIHINTSTSLTLYGFPDTSFGKHEFACISVVAVHIHTSTGYL